MYLQITFVILLGVDIVTIKFYLFNQLIWYIPSSQIVARQVRSILSLSWAPSLAMEIMTFRREAGNFAGHTTIILRIKRKAWMRSMSLSRQISRDLKKARSSVVTIHCKKKHISPKSYQYWLLLVNKIYPLGLVQSRKWQACTLWTHLASYFPIYFPWVELLDLFWCISFISQLI